ncbi:hypothetical protein MSAN_00944400 [Mycena sanguinolenta]|uniref:Uncharacterized protein n=1 Tax=Mycena sanguinolenta TaxID=230812 RepID=A0A8H6YTF1_9AGAR|nr:hypothetical protein MSAN_00944400 [Mycena sanguinolenta]
MIYLANISPSTYLWTQQRLHIVLEMWLWFALLSGGLRGVYECWARADPRLHNYSAVRRLPIYRSIWNFARQDSDLYDVLKALVTNTQIIGFVLEIIKVIRYVVQFTVPYSASM